MNLPRDIESQILSYLHLELGEEPGEPGSLTAADLMYEGEFEIQGVSTHYWRYVPEGKRGWATVEPFGDSFCIGMTSNSPDPVRKSDQYIHLHIEADGSSEPVRLKLENWGDGSYGLEDFKPVRLPSGETIGVLAEARVSESPPGVSISIEDGSQTVDVRASVGICMAYTTRKGTEVLLTLGTGSWE